MIPFWERLCYNLVHGALAQLGARHIRIVEAVGSNPICSMREKNPETVLSPDFFLCEKSSVKPVAVCSFVPYNRMSQGTDKKEIL